MGYAKSLEGRIRTFLRDPLDKLANISAIREPTVDDLVDALCITEEEAELIQLMTIGQQSNSL